MQYALCDGALASWWGQDSYEDKHIQGLLDAAAGTPFQWAIYYEPEGIPGSNPTSQQINSDLQYIVSKYAGHANYLHINGRFVVFVYGKEGDDCTRATAWKQANTINAFIVLKVFPKYRNCPDQPDSWHEYAPANDFIDQSPYSVTISPGFWKAGEKEPRLSRDLKSWQKNVARMVRSGVPFHLITTFNEWGEGTGIESAEGFESKSGNGDYADILRSTKPSRYSVIVQRIRG